MLAQVRAVVITDRRITGIEAITPRVAAILAAVPRGSVLIQIREKDLDGGPLLQLARDVLAVARPAGAPVWLNDRVDVALAAGADGVHLPEHGLALADARTIATTVGRPLALGVSRHTPDAARAAAHDGADLVQLGPIWATPHKGAPLGTDALAVRAELPPSARLVAVGGIDGPERARQAAAAGADAVALIRAAWNAADPGATLAAIVDAVDAGRAERRKPA